ncbi:hypothetical protein LPU83_pLPU83b_0111 (plasmid) [Rhizobium favelukesii]|uniref:Uncharacterized protein n=1 Tax=Rhizobium favelukesii TaxID=348824 RepID=W6RIB1_9HYPH|nr:hypothetical protein LPU83_pLPU83b_0111 [Rhizobium favelukesii]
MTTPLITQPRPRWELQQFRIRLAFSAVTPSKSKPVWLIWAATWRGGWGGNCPSLMGALLEG